MWGVRVWGRLRATVWLTVCSLHVLLLLSRVQCEPADACAEHVEPVWERDAYAHVTRIVRAHRCGLHTLDREHTHT